MTRKDSLLLGISVALTCLAGEVAARFLLPPPLRLSKRHVSEIPQLKHVPDADLGWAVPVRDAVYPYIASGKKGSDNVRYSIRGGFRASGPRPTSGPLLIAAGCSFTFGQGLNDEDTWPWLVQERLPQYQVLNTGVGGYGTDQALMAAERALLHAGGTARLVVLGFGDFQIERNRTTQGMIYRQYPMGKPLFLASGSGLESRGLVRFWYPGSLPDHSVLFMHVTNRMANLVNRIPSHEGAREVTARLMEEFSKRFEKQGAQLAVLVLPHAGDQPPQSKADRAFIVQRLHKAGIATLEPDFPRLPDGRLDADRFMIPSDEVHPNREYNMLVADRVVKWVNGLDMAP